MTKLRPRVGEQPDQATELLGGKAWFPDLLPPGHTLTVSLTAGFYDVSMVDTSLPQTPQILQLNFLKITVAITLMC